MNISNLNIRGRMVYGLTCLIAYLSHKKIDLYLFENELRALSLFTSARNLADWDKKVKVIISERFPEEFSKEMIPDLFDRVYWIGASELYGQPSNCKESETILTDFITLLNDNKIEIPNVSADASYFLNDPCATDDYFGAPFPYDVFSH